MFWRTPVCATGRFRAARFFGCGVLAGTLALSGCGFTGGPFWATAKSFIPGTHGNVSGQAKKIPYASIDLSFGRRGGLLVLAEQAHGLTFWQSRRREVIVLRHGYLASTAKTLPRLEMTERRGSDGQPLRMGEIGDHAKFVVERSWLDKKTRRHAESAHATWSCAPQTVSVKLPLTTRNLYKCTEALAWDNGDNTRSVYWRDSGGHVWKAEVVAWPGAPKISWRVARPWWPLKGPANG